MKKLNLVKLKMEGSDLLRREQLRTVFGGYGGYGSCSAWYKCNDGGSGFSDNTSLAEASALAKANCGSGGVKYIGSAGDCE